MDEIKNLKIKITMAEICVIVDTLIGSLDIKDGGKYWKFTAEQRQGLVNDLLKRLNNDEVNITIGGNDEENKSK